jgi:hypothetical protein
LSRGHGVLEFFNCWTDVRFTTLLGISPFPPR